MKICLLTPDSPYNQSISNGFISYVKEISDNLSTHGHDVIVLGFSKKVSKEQKLRIGGVEYWCLPDKGWSHLLKHLVILKFLPMLRELDGKVDIFHGMGGYALPLIFINKSKKVATLHGSEPFIGTLWLEKKIRIIFGKIIYERMNGLVFISPVIAKIANVFFNISKIPQITERAVFQKIMTRKKTRSDKYIKIIAASRIEKIKNLENLVIAVKALEKKYPIVLEIFGAGSVTDKIDSKYLRGEVDQETLWNKMSLSDIFVMPSISEVRPNSLLEAMQIGLVPMITRMETIDYIVEGKNGFLIDSKSSQDIYRALQGAIHNRARWNQIGHNATQTVLDLRDESKHLENFYKELVKK